MEEILDPTEVRVLGALAEKELSTPDYYPLTVNALTYACNQKSNRDPVVSYSEELVAEVIDQLQRKRLVGVSSGAYSRVTRYRHTLTETFDFSRAELALLTELMLRGPQTVGELRGRSSRMHPFDDLEKVETTLNALAARETPLVVQLPRQTGQKEARYAHLLSGTPDVVSETESPVVMGLEERVEKLESDVSTLREQLRAFEEMFEIFKKQFE